MRISIALHDCGKNHNHNDTEIPVIKLLFENSPNKDRSASQSFILLLNRNNNLIWGFCLCIYKRHCVISHVMREVFNSSATCWSRASSCPQQTGSHSITHIHPGKSQQDPGFHKIHVCVAEAVPECTHLPSRCDVRHNNCFTSIMFFLVIVRSQNHN